LFILHGIYYFDRKTVAYRNDFCLSCAGPRRADRIRSFVVLHIFFVPLVPLGFWRMWRCSRCGRSPHSRPGESRWYKWLLAAFFATLGLATWLAPESGGLKLWSIRIMFLGFFLAALQSAIRSKPDFRRRLKLKEKLAEIQPSSMSICQLCNRPMIIGEGCRCSACGAERMVLKA
jgi:hypothetical protein